MELKDKVALVTGAGSGIGKAAALLFAREGAKVGALSDTADEVRATVDEIVGNVGEAIALSADIANAEDVRRTVEDLVERFGRLDVVFANAGINGIWAPIEQLEPDEWDLTINTNLRGTYLTMRYCVPHLKKAGGGAVVFNASINGTRTFSNSGATAYGATKAGMLAMAQMLAVELAKDKIRVNALCPGRIDTEINDNTWPRKIDEAREPVEYPQGKIPLTRGEPGTSKDVAELALFLASDRARHITGTPVWIDGAQSLLIG